MYTTQERRVKPRVSCDYPAIIEGIDVQGQKYEDNGKLANLSASGLYMMVNREIELGTKLSVTVLLCSTVFEKETPKLATNGIVVRTEPQTGGKYGVAIKFQHYRFL